MTSNRLTKQILAIVLVTAIFFVGFYLLAKKTGVAPTSQADLEGSFPSAPETTIEETSTAQPTEDKKPGFISSIFGLGQNSENQSVSSKIRKPLSMAIAGYTLSDQGKSMVFMEKATGHIARLDLQSGSTTIISNTTLPGVEEAYWGTEGANLRVIARYLKTEWDIESLSASVPLTPKITASSTDNRQLTSVILDNRSYAFAVSPDGKKIFSLNYTPAGEAVGLISDFGFKNPTEVWRSPLTEWLPTWVGPNLVTLQTKSSGGATGFLFSLSLSTGRFTKLLGPINGFTALPSAGLARLAYSGSDDNFKLKIYDPATDKTSAYVLQTLPEKCVWTADSQKLYCAVPAALPAKTLLPDTWYSGEVSFADNIWLIDTKTGETKELFQQGNASETGGFDAINLSLDPLNQKLYFRNKNDLTLWSLDLKENSFAPVATTSAR